ncbi:protein LURP-one-related 5-like [Panicum miliaceum]|uniref:Protein LURP-one-related 5-like n=1 Tax=Panicum miliaceum TaxID=4540 RepID=A0A3L6Q367_PANMI|nr:protein LURP-one-related 5-like [Panicum miliaceum]
MTAAFPDLSSMTISRIHPSDSESETTRPLQLPHRSGGDAWAAALRYTVWKRSSMGFQGTDGFSIYDAAGALAFRVDNYSRRRKLFAGELLLMDGQGAPLIALRPQIFSMHDQWNCYRASEESQGKRTRPHHLFSMRKCLVLQKGHEAQVSMSGCSTASDSTGQGPSFWVEGCFRRRSCKIRNSDGEEVARILRKKAEAAANSLTLGEDVFSLVIQPNVDCTMIMAFIVVLDRICWRPYTPMICSS